MNVLIAAFDLFSNTGGGETFFQRLTNSNPSVHYTYLHSNNNQSGIKLPHNVEFVAVSKQYRSTSNQIEWSRIHLGAHGPDFSHEGQRIAELMDIAASVRMRYFDIIEIPDYLVHGWLLLPFLKHFGVTWQKIVLSMHGTISDALRDNWPGDAVGSLAVLEYTESMLFRTCDIRYGIGRPYVDAWSQTEGLPALMLDPAHILDLKQMSRGRLYEPDNTRRAPDLAFVGRQDKWKGPDVFLELCSILPRRGYTYIHLYGSATTVYDFVSTREIARIAENRGIKYQTNRKVPHDILLDTFSRQPIITVLPSRRDTFNLTALESLLSGCPTAISSRCGAVDYLERALPGLDYIKFDVEDLYGAAQSIGDVLDNYPERRLRLREKLKGLMPTPVGLSIGQIYQHGSAPDNDARHAGEIVAHLILEQYKYPTRIQSGNCKSEIRRDFGEVARKTNYQMGVDVFELAFDTSAHLSDMGLQLGKLDDTPLVLEQALNMSESLLLDLHPQIGAADRLRMYKLLAELEGARGNQAIQAAYAARIMRLSGRARPAEIGALCTTLEQLGLPEEAKVARLVFGNDENGLYDYLSARLSPSSHRNAEPEVVERLDYRRGESPRVTVVVSLYNGAKKLPRFVNMLESQSESAREVMEVVFVDSNSTDATRDVLIGLLEDKSNNKRLSALYVRSKDRETIQKAWNRGIVEARGEILTFLGNDEAMRPDTIDLFLSSMDKDPSIDWIQGNAIVTEVDELGAYVKDIFPHRRYSDSQNVQYLECCYIGFAGAAYRKDLHTRFGLYDDHFRSAGDNEWKNRILNRIRVHTLNETLGSFLNYPETRTTESPIAELEDIRAWYAFRTPGGIRFAFENQSDSACVKQFYRSLSYNRSYSTETSTDLEYADAMAQYLRAYRPDAYRALQLDVAPVNMLLNGYRALDEVNRDWERPSHWQLEDDLNSVKAAVRLVAEGSELLTRRDHKIPFWYRNDNRSQQHYFPWYSMQRRFDPGLPLAIDDVAGAQDLPELVSSAGPQFRYAQFESAWLDNHLDQLHRLEREQDFDVFLPSLEQDPTTAFARILARELKTGDRHTLSVIVAGPVSPELASEIGDRFFFTGTVKTERPLLSASKLMAIPGFTLAEGRRFLRHAVDALWHGLPLVMGCGVADAFKALLPGTDLDGLEVADTPVEFARRLIEVSASQARQQRVLAVGARLSVALKAASMVSRPIPKQFPRPWNAHVKSVARLVHTCFEDNRDGTEELYQHERNLADNDYRSAVAGTLESLLVKGNAPLLQTEQPLFIKLSSMPRSTDLSTATAQLYLFGQRRALPAAARLVAAARLRYRSDWETSPIGAWRSSRPNEAAPAKIGKVLLLGTESFWSSKTAEVEQQIAAIRGDVGGELILGCESDQVTAFGGAEVAHGSALDVAARLASVIVLLSDPSGSRGELRLDASRLWSRALDSNAVVLGTQQALWFADGLRSPAILKSPVAALQTLRILLTSPKKINQIAGERQRLLDRLGLYSFDLSAQREQNA